MEWQLHKVEDVDCTLDESGVYVIISRVEVKATHKEYAGVVVHVRADLMTADNEPIVSFVGKANAVRKHLIGFVFDRFGEYEHDIHMNLEHASYIGWELRRAETTPNYVQD